jgi:hypothetical protein
MTAGQLFDRLPERVQNAVLWAGVIVFVLSCCFGLVWWVARNVTGGAV